MVGGQLPTNTQTSLASGLAPQHSSPGLQSESIAQARMSQSCGNDTQVPTVNPGYLQHDKYPLAVQYASSVHVGSAAMHIVRQLPAMPAVGL